MNNHVLNPILNTDGYKPSHYLQFPKGTNKTFAYIEPRGNGDRKVVWFGLQYILKEYLSKPIDIDHVEYAREILDSYGVPFNYDGFKNIVYNRDGRWPVKIRALPEGTVVNTGIATATIESTDPEFFWVPGYLETMLLRVWYPSNVATTSFKIKQHIKYYMEKTGADMSTLDFKLHDFGARGVSSFESSMIGGLAHLTCFQGSDTLAAVLAARNYYLTPNAAFSIPAAEHSTITSYGRDGEEEAYRNMIRRFSKPGSMYAVVSDSYDIHNAVRNLWGGSLKEEVIKAGGTLIVRPDSGTPHTIVADVADILSEKFGYTLNQKGYKVLNNVRIIQGDGIDAVSIVRILATLANNGFSADNIAFGMGGALLQKTDRDTHSWACKVSAIEVDGKVREVYKDPATDRGKKSKKGYVVTVNDKQGAYSYNDYYTLDRVYDRSRYAADAMETVYENGRLMRNESLTLIRNRINEQL